MSENGSAFKSRQQYIDKLNSRQQFIYNAADNAMHASIRRLCARPHDVIISGAGPAGLNVAARLSEKGINVLLLERWGFSLPTLPEGLADAMTLGVIVAAVFIILRRIALPEVRIITKPYDFVVLAIAVAPFLTGFLAYHQVGSYDFWIVAHVVCGEIMLVAIPFTKLSHFLLFFLSRAQLGMDYGIKRGGMKNKGMAW